MQDLLPKVRHKAPASDLRLAFPGIRNLRTYFLKVLDAQNAGNVSNFVNGAPVRVNRLPRHPPRSGEINSKQPRVRLERIGAKDLLKKLCKLPTEPLEFARKLINGGPPNGILLPFQELQPFVGEGKIQPIQTRTDGFRSGDWIVSSPANAQPSTCESSASVKRPTYSPKYGIASDFVKISRAESLCRIFSDCPQTQLGNRPIAAKREESGTPTKAVASQHNSTPLSLVSWPAPNTLAKRELPPGR